jgi:alpha-galactosidase
MGWNSWNYWNCNVNSTILEQAAAIMNSSGLQAAGYRCVDGRRGQLGLPPLRALLA